MNFLHFSGAFNFFLIFAKKSPVMLNTNLVIVFWQKMNKL